MAAGSSSSEMKKVKQIWGRREGLKCKGGGICWVLGHSSSFFHTLSLLQLQLPRTGSPPPPLFLPTDPPMAWLLAKCWVRSSDFQFHELLSHLLRGHLMAEVIAMATMRCLPSIHPIFKVIPYPLLSCLSLCPMTQSHVWRCPLCGISGSGERPTNER